MNYKLIHQGLIYCIHLMCMLCFILPFSIEFNPWKFGESDDGWGTLYFIQQDILVLYPTLSFIAIWITLQVTKATFIKSILKVLSFMAAGYQFFVAFLSVSMPMQDFIPSYGYLLLLGFFPCIILVYTVEYWVNDETAIPTSSDLLDD